MKMDAINPNREIETEFLKIHGNCLEFQNINIQLSNISLLSTEEIAPAKFPTAAIVLIAIGLIMMLLHFAVSVLIGIALIAAGGLVIYAWYKQTQKRKQLKKLVIVTNSGNLFTIVFQNQQFLTQVLKVLKEVMSNPRQLSDVTINIKDNTFASGASLIQDYQEVHF